MRPQDYDLLLIELREWVNDQAQSIVMALRQCPKFVELFLNDCRKSVSELDSKYHLTDCFQDFTRTANRWHELSDVEWASWRRRALRAVRRRLRRLYRREFRLHDREAIR